MASNKNNDVSDVIKAAMERTKAKKAAAQQKTEQHQPRNTKNLTPAQQQQIDHADSRRSTALANKDNPTDKE